MRLLTIGINKIVLIKYNMNREINIVFGASGLIGNSIFTLNKKNKNFFFFSKTDKKFIKYDLNKSLTKFPFKKINNCFFLSSPRILEKNFNQNKFKQEYYWLKNVIDNIKIDKMIYLSSSSVYIKNNLIGETKRKCEKLILKNKNKFNFYQIWRPFNIVGKVYTNSDHFHNYCFKKMFLEKKKSYTFFGGKNDKRGYSEVKNFTKILMKYSKKNVNLIKNYGNKNLITFSQILKIYNKKYKKIFNNSFNANFSSNTSSTNSIIGKKNCVYFKKRSIKVIHNYLRESLSEKKL